MKVYNPQWNRDMNVSDKLATYMKENGYEPWHTGGGCMAWKKELRDAEAQELNDSEAYILITFVDVELGTWKERNDPQWIVGRYVWTDCDESWVCCDDALTLARAVEVGTQLPEPKDEQRIITLKDLRFRYDVPISSPDHADFCKREAERRYGGKIIKDSLGMLLVQQSDNGILHTDDVLRALSRYEA